MNKKIIEFAKTHQKKQQVEGILARAFIQAHEALEEINRHNRVSNDLQDYLYKIAKWGMGERPDRPIRITETQEWL